VDGLQLAAGQSALAGFVLAAARTGGFVLVAPPFNTRSLGARPRVAAALALALPLSTALQRGAPPLASPDLVVAVLLHLVLGVTLGFVVLVAVTAIQIVGDLIDLVGGFNVAVGIDPLNQNQTSIMGRVFSLLAGTLLFASDGHLMIVQGLVRSATLAPAPASLDTADIARTLTHDFAHMVVAGMQIAAPIVAVMLIADLSLGLMAKAAPAMNVFALAYPVKIMLTLLIVSLVVATVPDALGRLAEQATLTVIRLAGG
jgi:flagellar biosynthetic protein FliR